MDDRLTAKQIEQWREWSEKEYPLEFRKLLGPKFRRLCDLALSALRQDSSGGEAWHCPLHHPEWCSCPQPREPSHEEIIRQSKILVDAAEGEFWRDAVVQWPQRFLHARDCNVHSPTLRPCSCLLETRLKGEILRLHRAAPQESRSQVLKQATWAIGELPGGSEERDNALSDAIDAVRAIGQLDAQQSYESVHPKALDEAEPSVDYARGLAEGLEEGARTADEWGAGATARDIRAKIKPRTDEREGS